MFARAKTLTSITIPHSLHEFQRFQQGWVKQTAADRPPFVLLPFRLFLSQFLAHHLLSGVHAVLVVEGLAPTLPGVDVELVDVFGGDVWRHHDVERLTLIDKFLSVTSVLDEGRLINLSKGSEHLLLIISQTIKVLH